MIFCRGFVFVGIPHCASRSISTWLVRTCGGKTIGGHHDYKIPEEYKDCPVWGVTRNPFDRITKHHPSRLGDDAFREWLARYRKHAVISWPISRWIREAGITQTVRFEDLPDCLNELPFVRPGEVERLPHLGKRASPCTDELTDVVKKEILCYYHEDLKF